MTARPPLAYEVQGLALLRSGRRLLEDAELAIEAGQATAVVGPNGAGKTTLLKFLAFLSPMPYRDFRFFGTPVAPRHRDWQRLRRRVTYVSQAPYLFRGTVWDNVALGVSLHGRSDAARVRAALQRVGLEHLASRSAQRLSGGEAQRVALARALAIDPDVYLLDEPAANVDRDFVVVLGGILAELAERGRTVVFSTHAVAQAYRWASRIWSLDGSRLVPFALLNVWKGQVVGREGDLVRVSVAEGKVLAAIGNPPEQECTLTVDPESVVLARQPVPSSARNCLHGHVSRLEGDAAALLVFVDCGIPVVARVTASAARELQLAVGTPVWVIFKASAVHVSGTEPRANSGERSGAAGPWRA